jgi:hypothetical protein
MSQSTAPPLPHAYVTGLPAASVTMPPEMPMSARGFAGSWHVQPDGHAGNVMAGAPAADPAAPDPVPAAPVPAAAVDPATAVDPACATGAPEAPAALIDPAVPAAPVPATGGEAVDPAGAGEPARATGGGAVEPAAVVGGGAEEVPAVVEAAAPAVTGATPVTPASPQPVMPENVTLLSTSKALIVFIGCNIHFHLTLRTTVLDALDFFGRGPLPNARSAELDQDADVAVHAELRAVRG